MSGGEGGARLADDGPESGRPAGRWLVEANMGRGREIKPLVFDHSQRDGAGGDQGSEPLTDHSPLFAATTDVGHMDAAAR